MGGYKRDVDPDDPPAKVEAWWFTLCFISICLLLAALTLYASGSRVTLCPTVCADVEGGK